ncbi:TonB-dependent receptor [Pelagerythrobacter marensis]|uniref:TonB-dependent receptor n=1 Tax=Pelagerythrobacter marensis TaxID=543877 RepID=A0A0G3XAV6_9SPHN|nr:TonB-dependent receptor [Pelagerythrobacter marensis]AKM07761.1 TonB-dependent receptor [Pelagerythrobacter marensis]
MFRSSVQLSLLLLATTASGAIATAPAMAQGAPANLSATRSFSVPAGDLAPALTTFSRVTGVQIVFSPDLVRGKTTRGVSGSRQTREALSHLLAGTGLKMKVSGNIVAIVPGASGGTARSNAARPAQRTEPAAPVATAQTVAETTSPPSAIVVTGSRIPRPELESAMPVSAVSMEQAEQFGLVTAYDALIREPAVGPGTGPGSNNRTVGGNGGTASIDLRNMGTNRTLVMVDGRRRVSGSHTSSAVDLNMIPAGMIERIEVITGGAAAIYGADAVSGAVNVVTKRRIDGIDLSAQTGISSRGDARTMSLSAVAGTTLDDGRGSISLGVTYVDSEIVLLGDRKHMRDKFIIFANNPENTGPNDGIPDRITYDKWGLIGLNTFPTFFVDGQHYGYENGSVRELNYDIVVRTPSVGDAGIGGDGVPFHEDLPLRTPLEQFAAIAKFEYALTDTIDYHARLDFGHTKTRLHGEYYREDSRNIFLGGAGGPKAYLDNPYLPDPIRDFMVENGLSELSIARASPQLGQQIHDFDRHAYTIFSGLTGTVGDFDWEIFGQYGKTSNRATYPNAIRASRLVAARDVIADPVTGAPVCRDEAARAAGCVPYNIFGYDEPTEAQRDWMYAVRERSIVNTQTIFGASIVGSAFSLPYGDVSLALGAEYRRDTLKRIDDPLATLDELAHFASYGRVLDIDASQAATEGYAELVVPVLEDLPFAQRLQVEGAYRYSDYDRSGGTSTWKVGATWAPIEDLTFRAVRSRSVRAPNFQELYNPVFLALSTAPEPCHRDVIDTTQNRRANCAALGIEDPWLETGYPLSYTGGGNPDVQPETSNSLTIGAVFQPRFLPGFDATVDFWRIDIDDVITTLSAGQVAKFCVDLPTIENRFCDAITRDPVTRRITSLNRQVMNASNLFAEGIDFGMRFRHPLGGGMFNAGAKVTYLLDKTTQAAPGTDSVIVREVTGYADPRVRGSFNVGYDTDHFTFGWFVRVHGSSVFNPDPTLSDEFYEDNSIRAAWYHDVSVSYKIDETYKLTFGINNIFDEKMPDFHANQNVNNGIYDTIGRYLFARINTKF